MSSVRLDIEGSKSLALRHLVISIATGCSPRFLNLPHCQDVENMQNALHILCSDNKDAHIDIGEGAAPMRFLTALAASIPGTDVTIVGRGRLPQRPIVPLVEILRSSGADISYPPMHILGKKLRGGELVMPGDVTSQFISAILLVSPLMQRLPSIELASPLVSAAYVDMTVDVMRTYGYTALIQDRYITVEKFPDCLPQKVVIEADWSSVATMLYFVLLKGCEAEVPNLFIPSLSTQPDACIASLLQGFGLGMKEVPGGIRFFRESSPAVRDLQFDASNCPDAVLSLAVFNMICGNRFEISGTSTLKHKESDRAEVLRREVAKLGYILQVSDDSISFSGDHIPVPGDVKVLFDPAGDHRIAMALAQFKILYPDINIADKHVVNKSYPQFWHDLLKLGIDFDD